jgi:hypothetical protein
MCTVMKLDPKIRVFRGSYSVSTRKKLRLPNSVEILTDERAISLRLFCSYSYQARLGVPFPVQTVILIV